MGNTVGSESELGMCRLFPLLLNRKFPAEGPGEEKDKTTGCSHAKDTAAVWAPESLTAAPVKDKNMGFCGAMCQGQLSSGYTQEGLCCCHCL